MRDEDHAPMLIHVKDRAISGTEDVDPLIERLALPDRVLELGKLRIATLATLS